MKVEIDTREKVFSVNGIRYDWRVLSLLGMGVLGYQFEFVKNNQGLVTAKVFMDQDDEESTP